MSVMLHQTATHYIPEKGNVLKWTAFATLPVRRIFFRLEQSLFGHIS
jgi:hypothetical protein